MEVPVRIWSVNEGIAHGVRLDIGETVEFDLRPGDTLVVGLAPKGGQVPPIPVDVARLRPYAPTWGTAPSA